MIKLPGHHPPIRLKTNEAGYPSTLKTTPGGADDGKVLAWDDANSAFDLVAQGGTSTGRVAIISADGIPSIPASYEQVASGLRLKLNRDFPFAVADYIANVEAGWSWLNSGALDSADADTTTADALNLNHGNTSTVWNSSTQTCPVLYRTGTLSGLQGQDLVARLACNGDANFEILSLLVARDGARGTYGRIGVGYSGGIKIVGNATGSSLGTVGITSAQRDQGVWVRMLIRPGGAVSYLYSTANQAAPPTSWTQLATDNTFTGVPYDTLIYGLALQTVNTSDTLVGDVLYFDDQYFHPAESLEGDFVPAAGGGFDDANPEIELVSDWDLGSDAPSLNDTALNQVLTDGTNRLPGDAATWTFSSIQSAGLGAGSGVFQGIGSISTSGSGRYWSLFAKASSDGTQAGSIALPLAVPVL